MKKLYKEEKIDLDNTTIIDNNTGEVIEFKNTTVIKRTTTGKSTVSSNKYLILDQERFEAIQTKGIKLNELGFLISMCQNLMFNYNISMYDLKTPHSAKSLSIKLNITEQSASRLLRRLIELDIVHKGKLDEMKNLGTVYIINPYFIRVGKNFSSKLDELFDDPIKKKVFDQPNTSELY
jgi:predicted transcriptional regulator